MQRSGTIDMCEIYALDNKGDVIMRRALNVIPPENVTVFTNNDPTVNMGNLAQFKASLREAVKDVVFPTKWVVMRYWFRLISYDVCNVMCNNRSPPDVVRSVASRAHAAVQRKGVRVGPPTFDFPPPLCEIYTLAHGHVIARRELTGVIRPQDVTEFTRNHPIVQMSNAERFIDSFHAAVRRIGGYTAGWVALRYGQHIISYDLHGVTCDDYSSPEVVEVVATRVHADIVNMGVQVNPPKFDGYWQAAHQARYDRMRREEAYNCTAVSPTQSPPCIDEGYMSPPQSVSPCVRPRRPLSVRVE